MVIVPRALARIFGCLLIVFQVSICEAQERLLVWQSTNLQLLRGEGFELSPRDRATIVTVEHANRWSYGDFYGFVDIGVYHGTEDTTYAEGTPRLRLSKLSNRQMDFGAIEDVYLAGQVEFVEGGARRYMKGVGVDLAVPGFDFVKANFFHRNNPARPETTWQMYLAWKARFRLGGYPMVFEGFADVFGDEGGNTVASQLLVPRLLLGIGSFIDESDHKLQVGIEWQYWHNKFGVDGRTESVPQLQVKYTL